MSSVNAKTYIDQTANMATMCAFTVPIYGAGIAAGISVVTGILNLIIPALAANTPTGLQSLNKQDLQNAVDALKDDIADALFNNDVDNASTWIINFNSDQLLANISKAQHLGLDKKTLFFPTDKTTAKDVKELDAFFEPDPKSLQDLLDNRDVLTRSSANDKNLSPADLAAHRTNTTPLYCFAGSAIVLFLKTSVAWNWAEEILYCEAYKKWHAAMKVWGGKSEAYKKIHPEQDPDRLYPGVGKYSATLPTWQDWCANGQQTKPLEDAIAALVGYSIRDEATKTDGLYTTMVKNWEARLKAVASVEKYHVNVHTTNSVNAIVNSKTNIRTKAQCTAIAEAWNEIDLGVSIANTWDQHTTQYSLEKVAFQDLELYHHSLTLWQDALEDFKFQTVIAHDGDTPKKIAQRVYKDASLYTKLLNSDGTAFKTGDEDLTGTRVKAPDLNPNRVAVPPLPKEKI